MWRRRPRTEELLRARVVVHTRDKKSIAGVLLAVYPDCISLASARWLNEDRGAAIPLDGETVIPHRNISFMQAGVDFDDTRGLMAIARGIDS